LEYHLGNCKGPCEGLQTLEDYDEGISQLKDLLKGNLSPVINNYKNQIKHHVANLAFEKAAIYQHKIAHLQEYEAKSSVVNTNSGTVDVFTILEEDNIAYVNYLAVNNGSIIQTKTITLQKQLDETAEEVLAFGIAQMRQLFESEAREIVIPFEIEYVEPEITITIPKAGDKKKLLDLSQKNVNYFKAELHAKKMLHLQDKTTDEKIAVLKNMQADLQLQELPIHIECFDNSNFQGSYPVSAMVCFKNGEPSKADYRHFNIKTVEGINDFASMEEVVYRRYKRLTEEGTSLPQLIIIDGGKGQLSSAMLSIDKLNLRGQVTLVGLAKNKEEIFFDGDTQSLLLPWDSETLKLIRRIRDEVHRFGITHHRNRRSKGTFVNELEAIKGIGKQTADVLLNAFRSVKNIKAADDAMIEKLIGKAKFEILKAGLK
jgi:excinuclease ABC subunit C